MDKRQSLYGSSFSSSLNRFLENNEIINSFSTNSITFSQLPRNCSQLSNGNKQASIHLQNSENQHTHVYIYHLRFMMGYCYIHLSLWLNGSFKLSFMMCRLLRSHSHLMSHDSLYWGLAFQMASCSPLPKTSLSTRILGSELQLSY